MKIYDYEGFPNPARVRMALAEKGVVDNVTFVGVDVPNGEHRQKAFLQKNPLGTVPLLELDCGTTISECTAITEYIDHQFEGVSLTGSTAKQRGVVHMMQRRAEQGLLDAVGAYFHHATPGLGPELETDQNETWGLKQKDTAVMGMKYFDDILANNEFVAGDYFSMADITLYAGLAFADFAKIEMPVDCTNLASWRQRMSKRPSMSS